MTLSRTCALALLFLVSLARCATTTPVPAAAVHGPPHVTIEKQGAAWLATWTLAEPARQIRFERPAAGFRAETFEVLTPGYAFGKDGESEILRTDGEPQRTIRVRFPVVTRHLPKEYEFFQAFSDGSVAIYTGHLLAAPERCSDCLVRNFRLVPAPGESVIAGGNRSSAPLAWRDQTGEGTYAYFGSIHPVESAEMISIVDPGHPDGDLVTAIGGHDVLREGHRAWDRLHESCGTPAAIRVSVVSPAGPRELAVPCRTAVAVRPAYLRIESRPRQ